MIKNSWRGPVWGLVVAAAITGSAFYLWGWSLLVDVIKAAPALFTSLIPVWVLIFLAPLVVFALALIYFIYSTRETDIREPDFVAYTDDTVFDINWSWQWLPPTVHGNRYTLRNLTPYCPSCSALLDINDKNRALVRCRKEECNWQWNRQHLHESRLSSATELDANVRTEINRRIHARTRN